MRAGAVWGWAGDSKVWIDESWHRGALESGGAAPATGPKKEPGDGERGISGLTEGGSHRDLTVVSQREVSQRGVSGLTEGGSYTSEASGGAADCRQDTLLPLGARSSSSHLLELGLTSGWLSVTRETRAGPCPS